LIQSNNGWILKNLQQMLRMKLCAENRIHLYLTKMRKSTINQLHKNHPLSGFEIPLETKSGKQIMKTFFTWQTGKDKITGNHRDF